MILPKISNLIDVVPFPFPFETQTSTFFEHGLIVNCHIKALKLGRDYVPNNSLNVFIDIVKPTQPKASHASNLVDFEAKLEPLCASQDKASNAINSSIYLVSASLDLVVI